MERAIGIIDSGVGGLTVAYELMRQLPKERLIYLGDTMRCPYGSRSKEEVQKFTWEMVDFLLNKNIKMLVIACNTATAFTLEEIERKLSIPVIGVINPGARTAIKFTKNNHVAIIGTEGTIRSGAYTQTLKAINAKVHVNALSCPLLVPMIEQGILSGEKAEKVVEETLAPIKLDTNIDTLILGCTHYPLIKDIIQKVIGSYIKIVSSSEETARETSTILGVHGLLNLETQLPSHKFYSTGELKVFTKITQDIFNNSIDNLQLVTIQKVLI